jgi:hypothetical protein
MRPGKLRVLVRGLVAAAVLVLLPATAESASATAAGAPFPGSNGAIVFQRTLFEPNSTEELFRINPDGTDEQRLTTNTVGDYQPTWSPDSSRIAFARFVCGPSFCSRRIFVMNADGSGARPITFGIELAIPENHGPPRELIEWILSTSA